MNRGDTLQEIGIVVMLDTDGTSVEDNEFLLRMKQIENHITINSADKIAQISKPLKKFKIENFTYLKLYKNGERVYLSSDPCWSLLFFKNFYKCRYLENIELERTLESKFYFRDEHVNNLVAKDKYDNFGVRNSMCLCFNQPPEFKEFFYFSSSANSKEMENFYFNHLDIISRFSFYFKQEAEELIGIHSLEENRIQTPLEYSLKLQQKKLSINKENPMVKEEAEFIKETEISRINFFNGDVWSHLTKREIECLKFFLHGKSAHQIAESLNISTRTVEHHFENIKLKLNCFKQKELISKIINSNILCCL